ncbi:MAG: endolytic transglycosylase MltG [Candidatus Pacebacteria bacterium]|nr:endolytic transglycosylase MltG [Candidatus Paceibacterota bacterium]MBP9818762.1 endolytic transglycosylase MltG [Candidatus Paceibacterota bacterium]
MSKQRVTAPVPTYLKLLAVCMLFGTSILMTGTTTFLYKFGLDPLEFYSNVANPYMKLVNVPAGLRREEIALKFAKILSWDQENIDGFLDTAPKDERGTLDGYYLPGPYWVKTTSTGPDVAHQMLRNFNSKVSEQILNKKTSSSASVKNSTVGSQKINLDTAVRIASIIQREAAGDVDMRIISGVIWNRIFRGMSLDMDATLQYAKASEQDMSDGLVASASTSTKPIVWWPRVASKDKYIDSPFNTYQNKGLPPTAIANPSLKAIAAAFNPAKTDCLFYLHDNNRGFHCTKTYEAHKENVQRYLVGKK